MNSNKNIKKKICIVAPVHIYNDIRVFQKQARSLVEQGYDVTLFARCKEDKLEGGLHIHALPEYTRKKRFLALPLLLLQLIQSNADLYHLHNPDTLPLGFFLKLLRKKVVYDTHENFKELIRHKNWIPKVLRLPLAYTVYIGEKMAGSFFDAIIVTQKRQLKSYGRRCIVIENPPIVDPLLLGEVAKRAKTISSDSDTLHLIYPGLITRERGIFTLLELIEIINQKKNMRLWLLGKFEDSNLFQEVQKKRGWEYVDYLGCCDPITTFAYIKKADLGLILFHPVADNMYINPNKLFEYMTFSTPFIASDFPTWHSYLKGTDVGLWVDPLNIEGISNAILNYTKKIDVLSRHAEVGYRFIKEEYNWDIEKEKLLELYHQILNQ